MTTTAPVHRISWEDAYSTVIPLINAEGLPRWNFDSLLPLQVRFYTYDGRRDYRLCRHDYFEIFYVYSGELVFQLAECLYFMKKGDLIVLNSTSYHAVRAPSTRSSRSTIHGVLLYFMPEVIRGTESTGEDMEYLMPFLQQDAAFPHVVSAETGVTQRVYELIQLISSELPAASARARLCVKTYLKMILIQLVNHYAAYQGTSDVFTRNQRSIERLRPLFHYLDEHYDEPTLLDNAAAIVKMSKSHFLHFIKQVTGLSFVSYLNQFRISKAQELLVSTNKSGLAIKATSVRSFGNSCTCRPENTVCNCTSRIQTLRTRDTNTGCAGKASGWLRKVHEGLADFGAREISSIRK